MIRVAIVVEGQTEEEFVKRVLTAHLADLGVSPTPVLPGRRGGNISVERLASQMRELVHAFDAVTTLVDFYGFRGKQQAEPKKLESMILERVRRTLKKNGSARTVFPYVQRHEFEGLLFSDVAHFRVLPQVSETAVNGLVQVRGQFATPEDIDDGAATAPSKRLSQWIPRYRKSVHGPLIASAIGLERIRSECPRFGDWLKKLESLPEALGQPPA